MNKTSPFPGDSLAHNPIPFHPLDSKMLGFYTKTLSSNENTLENQVCERSPRRVALVEVPAWLEPSLLMSRAESG